MLPQVVFSIDWLSFTVWMPELEVFALLDGLGLRDGLEYTGHGAKGFQRLYRGLDGLQVKIADAPGRGENPDRLREIEKSDQALFNERRWSPLRDVNGKPIANQKQINRMYADKTDTQIWEEIQARRHKIEQSEKRKAAQMQNTGGYSHIVFPGEVCRKLTPEQFQEILELRSLNATRINVTRMDLAFDTQIFSVGEVWRAMDANELKTYAKRETFRHIEGVHDHPEHPETAYIGSRESDKYLRVYHKIDGCSFGDGVPFTRVELQLNGETALGVFALLVGSSLSEWLSVARGVLAGYVEFAFPAWKKFMNDAAPFAVRRQQKVPSVRRSLDWFSAQCLPTFAMLCEALKGQTVTADGEIKSADASKLIEKWLFEGSARLTEKHRAMLRNFDPAQVLQVDIFGGVT